MIMLLKILQELFFGLRIQGGSAFVQDEHAAAAEQSAGDGYALGLSLA